MDETCSSQSGFQRLGTSHNKAWIKHIQPCGDLEKLLQFPVFHFWTTWSAPRRLRLLGGPHPTVHSPQWTSSVGAVTVYLHGAEIDHNILHPPPTAPVRGGLPPTVHSPQWTSSVGAVAVFLHYSTANIFLFQVDYTGTNLCVTTFVAYPPSYTNFRECFFLFCNDEFSFQK